MDKADTERRASALTNYQTTRWLVMTAAALASFLGLHLLDGYVFGP
jgi:hypothetical protein